MVTYSHIHIQSHMVTFNLPRSADEQFSWYDSAVSGVLDEHAPIVSRRRKAVTMYPWADSELVRLRRERRTAEQLWRKTKLTVHRQMFESKRDTVDNHINKLKKEYYHRKLSSADQRSTYSTLNSLLKKPAPVNHCEDNNKLCESFSNFFVDKVNAIVTNLTVDQSVDTYFTLPQLPPPCNTLESLRLVTQEELRKIIMSSPSKSCVLDTVPTWFLQETLDAHLPALTTMVNTSISSGVFPSSAKSAVVTPLLKKTSLDPTVHKNFRPVSNLTFLGKSIERVVLRRMKHHMDSNNLNEVYQSAYKPKHCTETALLRVHNDLACHLDDNKAVMLVLLDLSAAFDTVRRDKLFYVLHSFLGVTGVALDWFRSYLSDRSQRVGIAGTFSNPKHINHGVPQGSVLGPVLFSIYTQPLERIIHKHGIAYHRYADDIQLYAPYDPSDAQSYKTTADNMQMCIANISDWMRQNSLQLNQDKTEVVIFMSPHQRRTWDREAFPVDRVPIIPSNSVRDLGVIFDEDLSMTAQVTSVVKACNFHSRNIGKIRRYLTTEACKTAIQGLVVSRMDYCCSLLTGLPQSQVRRLQVVQNKAARIVARLPFRSHVSPTLIELHWLPCDLRIKFRILTYVYKCLNDLAPEYLQDRSVADTSILVVQSSRERVGSQAFCHAAPALWNDLPPAVRNSCYVVTFKKALKTLYFKDLVLAR